MLGEAASEQCLSTASEARGEAASSSYKYESWARNVRITHRSYLLVRVWPY